MLSHHLTLRFNVLGFNELEFVVFLVFDESGNFVLYPTLLGVKVVNLVTNQLARVIGKVCVKALVSFEL